MFRRPMLWIAVLAGGAGALAFLPVTLPRDEPVTLASASPSPPAQSPAPRPAVLPAPAPSPAPRGPAPVLPRTDPALEQPDDPFAAQALSYDALLERQAGDPTRQALVRGRAELAFAEVEGVWLGDTECVQSICRVEVQLADLEVRQGFDRMVSRVPAGRGEVLVFLESEEDLDIELYVSRDDASLPLVQNP